MALTDKLTDRQLHTILRRIHNRPTHMPSWDAVTCTQCRVFSRIIDELRYREYASQSKGGIMKTIRKLSNRKLDELQDRLTGRLKYKKDGNNRHKILKKQDKVVQERLRRLGL